MGGGVWRGGGRRKRMIQRKSKIEIEMGKGGVGCNIFRAHNKRAPFEGATDGFHSEAVDGQTYT